jgi:hypothetical protein
LQAKALAAALAPSDSSVQFIESARELNMSPADESPMGHKHEHLIRAIFREPASGNIHWRDVESLLHHLGATLEPLSGARLRVRLNGVEGILHRPHHSNVLDRPGIRHVREYLAHARMTPSQYEVAAHRETRR